jgi:hypothetical protein
MGKKRLTEEELKQSKTNIVEIISKYNWQELEDEKFNDSEFTDLIQYDSKNSKQEQQSITRVQNFRQRRDGYKS